MRTKTIRGTALRRVSVALLGVLVLVALMAPPAQSRKKPAPTPTATVTPTATPTPESLLWNFDQDQAHKLAKGWNAVEGDWQVIPDPTAPSQPNTLGLPPGRVLSSLMSGLAYYAYAVVSDPREYGDFTLEAQFKPAEKRYFDCSGGLIFRYVDPKNYYVLSAGCPTDFFALSRVSGGNVETLKQTVVEINPGTWYGLKVVTEGAHISCYNGGKMVFDVTDSKISKGRIGVWAEDDSEARFDDVRITLPLPGEGGTSESGGASAPPP